MENTQQSAIINAVGATVPTIYSGINARISECSALGKTAMIAVGNRLDDRDIEDAVLDVNASATRHASRCVCLGLLCQAKKEALDARGNNQYSVNGLGFEQWLNTVLAGKVSTRQIRKYMEAARAFLVDFEAAVGEVPTDKETLARAVDTWCGERNLAEIRKEIRAEQSARELKASPDDVPTKEPQYPNPDEAKAEAMLKFNRILDRVLERDNELRSAFEQVAPEMDNAETTRYLEALANHYSDLFGFYDELVRKAKNLGANNG